MLKFFLNRYELVRGIIDFFFGIRVYGDFFIVWWEKDG